MLRKPLITILVICSFFLLLSCGSAGSDAPSGSTITIAPVEALYGGISGDTPVNFTVSVKNSNGVPLNDVDLFISGSFAVPRSPARYQFYSNSNMDGPINSGFTGRTNKEGVYNFSIKIYGTVGGSPTEFSDNINVQSATVSGSVAVAVEIS